MSRMARPGRESNLPEPTSPSRRSPADSFSVLRLEGLLEQCVSGGTVNHNINVI